MIFSRPLLAKLEQIGFGVRGWCKPIFNDNSKTRKAISSLLWYALRTLCSHAGSADFVRTFWSDVFDISDVLDKWLYDIEEHYEQLATVLVFNEEASNG